MSLSSKPHGNNKSRSTESEWDQTVTNIATGFAKAIKVLVWWSILFPMFSFPILMSLWLWLIAGPIFGVVLAAISALALVAWSLVWPASFEEWVTAPMRSRWRIWRTYRHPWTTICTLHGLTATMGERTLVPTLQSVTTYTTCDVVAVQILIGQSVADWQNKSAALTEAFQAQV